MTKSASVKAMIFVAALTFGFVAQGEAAEPAPSDSIPSVEPGDIPLFPKDFRPMDLNHDGYLDKAESKGELGKNFDRLDGNRDGRLRLNSTGQVVGDAPSIAPSDIAPFPEGNLIEPIYVKPAGWRGVRPEDLQGAPDSDFRRVAAFAAGLGDGFTYDVGDVDQDGKADTITFLVNEKDKQFAVVVFRARDAKANGYWYDPVFVVIRPLVDLKSTGLNLFSGGRIRVFTFQKKQQFYLWNGRDFEATDG